MPGKHLPKTWTVFDEIYQLKDFDRTKVHGLLTLDRLMLNADDIKNKKATPGDYPIAWRKDYGQGRVFYTSLGHREDIWDATWTEKNGSRKNSPEVAAIPTAYPWWHPLGAWVGKIIRHEP